MNSHASATTMPFPMIDCTSDEAGRNVTSAADPKSSALNWTSSSWTNLRMIDYHGLVEKPKLASRFKSHSGKHLRPKLWLQMTNPGIITAIMIGVLIVAIVDIKTVTCHPSFARVTRDYWSSRSRISDEHKSEKVTEKSNTNSIVDSQNYEYSDDSGPSLSIVSPLDVLRKSMLREIRKQRIRHAKHRQMLSNKKLLDQIG